MKNTYRALIFQSLFVLLGLARAHAQADFRPGYVVVPSGDTLRGLADYRGAARSARLCQFRATAQAPVTTYSPGELRGYGFPGVRAYRSCLTPLPDTLGLAQAPRVYFLEVLATGPASLYARRDRGDATYYYLQKGPAATAPVKKLEYRRVEVEVEGRKVFREINTFRNTLSEAFADCPSLSLDVLRTEYLLAPLIRLVNRYNACVQPQGSPTLIRKKSRLSVGLLAGAITSKLAFDGSTAQASRSYTDGPSFEAGLALQFVSPALNEKLMLRLEALYERQSYTDEYRYVSPYFSDATEQDRIRVTYLRLPLVLRYTVPRRGSRPFVEAGVVTNKALSTQAEYRVQYTATMPYDDWASFGVGNQRNIELGFLAGVGVQLPFGASRPVSLLGRAEWSNSVIRGASVLRYQLLLGINLTK